MSVLKYVFIRALFCVRFFIEALDFALGPRMWRDVFRWIRDDYRTWRSDE